MNAEGENTFTKKPKKNVNAREKVIGLRLVKDVKKPPTNTPPNPKKKHKKKKKKKKKKKPKKKKPKTHNAKKKHVPAERRSEKGEASVQDKDESKAQSKTKNLQEGNGETGGKGHAGGAGG